jgi:hypothetical protein
VRCSSARSGLISKVNSWSLQSVTDYDAENSGIVEPLRLASDRSAARRADGLTHSAIAAPSLVCTPKDMACGRAGA